MVHIFSVKEVVMELYVCFIYQYLGIKSQNLCLEESTKLLTAQLASKGGLRHKKEKERERKRDRKSCLALSFLQQLFHFLCLLSLIHI